MRSSGLRLVSGSWKIVPMRRPRMCAHSRRRQVVDALAVEPDFAAGDAAGRIEKADDGEPGERFAGAGFADDAEDLARRDVEGDAVERAQRAASGREFDAADREPKAAGRSFQPRVQRVAQPVAEQVDRQHQQRQREAGNVTIHHSPENRKFWPMRISVPSEGSVGGRPTPRKDSVASVMIGEREIDRGDHQHRPHDIGQDMADEDARRATSPITRAAST